MQRYLIFMLFFSVWSVPARAVDEGSPVRFATLALTERVDFTARGAGAEQVLWESPASDPLPRNFKVLLLEGTLSRPDVSFDASVFDGKQWGPWVRMEGERFTNGHFWAKASVSGKKGSRARLRAIEMAAQPAQAGSMEFYGFHASKAEGEGSSGAPSIFSRTTKTPARPAAPLMPDILSRDKWDARPTTSPYEIMTATRVTIHHTQALMAMTREDAVSELQAIQSYHQRGHGWKDIGYHFIIDGSGQIWEGRPIAVVGAHVKYNNELSIGIALMGNFHPPKNQRPTKAQMDSLVRLIRWCFATYRLPMDQGSLHERIKGHRDVEESDYTDCPGNNLHSQLDKIRKVLAQPQPPADAAVQKTRTARSRIDSLLKKIKHGSGATP